MIGIKIPWQVFACAGVVLAIYGWGELRHYQGKQEVQTQWDASIDRGKTIVRDLRANQGKVTTKIETVYVDRIKVIHEKAQIITKYVDRLIPVNTPDLPGGFRLLHDAAATNTIPDPTGEVQAQPVPVKDLALTIDDNYEACLVESEKLKGLWTWLQEQRQLYEEACKQQGTLCSKDSGESLPLR